MRILLIEDDLRIVNFVKRGLEAKGYAVDTALDGQDGLDKGIDRYDLIILDVLGFVRTYRYSCSIYRLSVGYPERPTIYYCRTVNGFCR